MKRLTAEELEKLKTLWTDEDKLLLDIAISAFYRNGFRLMMNAQPALLAMASRLVELESALDYLGCCAGVALVTPRYQADIDADNCIEAARELGWTSPTQKPNDGGRDG